MKIRTFVVLAALAVPVALFAAELKKIDDPRTLGRWRANEQAAKDIQANFDAIDAESVTAATAATVITRQTVAIPAGVTNAELTLQYGEVVIGDVTNAFPVLTNVTLTLSHDAGYTVMTNATAATTLSLTK